MYAGTGPGTGTLGLLCKEKKRDNGDVNQPRGLGFRPPRRKNKKRGLTVDDDGEETRPKHFSGGKGEHYCTN